jgi:hypothetical protein
MLSFLFLLLRLFLFEPPGNDDIRMTNNELMTKPE